MERRLILGFKLRRGQAMLAITPDPDHLPIPANEIDFMA